MAQGLAEEFRSTLREGLRPLKDFLVAVLRQLVEYDCPPEVVALDREVFSARWSEGFPARAFFMNESNSEHFIYVDETRSIQYFKNSSIPKYRPEFILRPSKGRYDR